MKSKWLAVLVGLFTFTAVSSEAEVGWILDILPGSVLASFSGDEFHVRGDGEEEETSLVTSIPSVAGGARWDFSSGYADLKGGAGLLLNQRVNAYTLYAMAEALFEAKRSLLVGPHVAYAWYLDPEWWGDGDVIMDDTTGWLAGISFIFGDRVSYVLSADYYSLTFDVNEIAPGWVANNSEIEMSGVAAQFGLRLQF